MYIGTSETKPVNVIITEVTGRIVAQETVSLFIDISKLANGVYVVEIYNDNGKINTTKIIKQ